MNTQNQDLAAVEAAVKGRAKSGLRAWRRELIFAAPIVLLVLFLFCLWFAVGDRYFTFLYFHDMGSRFDTSPFGAVTASRYWMSGLVAAGVVTVAYTASNLLLGRLFRSFCAPVWWRVWLLCASPLAVAIPVLVTRVNDPVLPPANAIQVTIATLAGLALALLPGQTAAEKPRALVWLVVDGFSLAMILLSLIRLDSISDWLARGRGSMVTFLTVLAGIGVAGVLLTTVYIRWKQLKPPAPSAWLAAGFAIAYLLLPLSHYLLAGGEGDTGHFAYITDSANFFADSSTIQLGIWGAVTLLVARVTRLRQGVVRQRTGCGS